MPGAPACQCSKGAWGCKGVPARGVPGVANHMPLSTLSIISGILRQGWDGASRERVAVGVRTGWVWASPFGEWRRVRQKAPWPVFLSPCSPPSPRCSEPTQSSTLSGHKIHPGQVAGVKFTAAELVTSSHCLGTWVAVGRGRAYELWVSLSAPHGP